MNMNISPATRAAIRHLSDALNDLKATVRPVNEDRYKVMAEPLESEILKLSEELEYTARIVDDRIVIRVPGCEYVLTVEQAKKMRNEIDARLYGLAVNDVGV